MDLVEIWQNALGELQVALSRANFATWFKNTFIYDFKKGNFTIGVPSIFYEVFLKNHYLKEITKALQNQIGETVVGIKFKIATPSPEQVVIIEKNKIIHRAVNKPEEKIYENSQKFSPQSLPKNSTLNEDYKFDNFVVGPSNQVAHAAAKAVSQKPGQSYNPLYIYGDSGLGKTHLMQAIGQSFLEKNPDKIVLYVTSETFINDFINAVQSGSGRAKDFKDRYRNVDILLIDDIQFLAGKETTQDEFFHTFNHLYQNKKQVVLTSDRYPKDINGLEKRLQTRFESGMVADISFPDLETREAILRQKAKNQGKNIDSKVMTFIAQNVQSSIRELEGSLTKIIATCELSHKEINEENTVEILKGIIEKKKQIVTPELIIREVHKYYSIPVEDLLGKKRVKEIVVPRQVAMYLLRHEANLSFPDIGKCMGGKDHSTIMHGVKKIEGDVSQNPIIKEDLANLKEKIFQILA